MIGIHEQITWIIYFLFFGFFLAVMHDVLKYVLGRFRINQVLSYIFQLFFWLALAYLATVFMMKVTEGAFTVYAFGFFALGALVHFLYFSKGLERDLRRFEYALSKIYKRVRKIIILIVVPKEVLLFAKKLLPKKQTIAWVKNKFRKMFRKEKNDEKDYNDGSADPEHPVSQLLQ